MKTDFLHQFYKDLDKISGQKTLDVIRSYIKNVEEAIDARYKKSEEVEGL